VWWGVFLLVILGLLAGIDSLMIFFSKVGQSSSLREMYCSVYANCAGDKGYRSDAISN